MAFLLFCCFNFFNKSIPFAPGTTAQCCFFSFYQPEVICDGNSSEAASAIGDFRAAAGK
jgi:hypothetical protein